MSEVTSCPCGSGKFYKHCCRPFHQGENPKDALALMRSRYSAYAMNNADYIIDTTHPDNPVANRNRDEILQFCQNTSFLQLTIHHFIHGQKTAYVLFTAHLEQGGQDATFTEKSRFEKVDGKWLYHTAQVTPTQVTS